MVERVNQRKYLMYDKAEEKVEARMLEEDAERIFFSTRLFLPGFVYIEHTICSICA